MPDELSFSHLKDPFSSLNTKLRAFTSPQSSIKEHKRAFMSFGGFMKTLKSDPYIEGPAHWEGGSALAGRSPWGQQSRAGWDGVPGFQGSPMHWERAGEVGKHELCSVLQEGEESSVTASVPAVLIFSLCHMG